MTGLRVLVCGGRLYDDAVNVVATLDRIDKERGIVGVMQGGASGADALALAWAKRKGIGHMTYRANWSVGPSAGPIRNQRMLDEGRPDIVVAFLGGKGTADMIARAKQAGVYVREA